MSSSVAPSFWQGSWQYLFKFKQHLQDFLNSNLETIEQKLALGQQSLKEIVYQDFYSEKASDYYRNRVGQAYLFDLAAWHMSNQGYIKGTLTLISDMAAHRVLDCGGGIGTHGIAAALCPQVEQVVYCDLNPIHGKFVQNQAAKLGLSDKLSCCREGSPTEVCEAIIC
jgi:hypothetical protein